MIKSFIRSMTGRFFLILLGGTIVSASLALALAAFETKDMLSQIRLRYMSERAEQIVRILESAPPDLRAEIVQVTNRSGLRIDLFPAAADSNKHAARDEALTAAIARALGSGRKVSAYRRLAVDCPVRADRYGTSYKQGDSRPCVTVSTTLLDGSPLSLHMAAPPDGLPAPFRANFLPYLLLFLLCVAGLALLVSHLATKPLRVLARAAHALGRNLEQPRLAEHRGPSEVREAASAFNSMQSQIRHFIAERTYMLAAIAHDLQTPLTRFRLRLEKLTDQELKAKLISDLNLTQEIVKEGMELARSMHAEEPFERLDLDSLVETVCQDAADAGQRVTYQGRIGASVIGNHHTLRRALCNLLDNAVKYGETAQVTLKRLGNTAIISIIDNGPGIPEDRLLDVLQPFKRLEDSRSRASGGTGLGLTIAANIAEKHGGSLRLRNIGAGRGLEAIIELPLR